MPAATRLKALMVVLRTCAIILLVFIAAVVAGVTWPIAAIHKRAWKIVDPEARL